MSDLDYKKYNFDVKQGETVKAHCVGILSIARVWIEDAEGNVIREIPMELWNDDRVLDLLRQLAYAKLMTQQYYNKIHFEGVMGVLGTQL